MAKIGIIGVGFVGATTAYALTLSGYGSDIILIDADAARAKAEAADISHGASLSHGTRVITGTFADLKGAEAVIIAAGANQKPGESRLDLVARNARIFASIVPQIIAVAPEAVIVIASNPVDIMTAVTKVLHPNPNLVFGSGTILDSARFRQLIAEKAEVSSRHVHANVIGEHGDSSVLCWSSALIAGLSIEMYMRETGKTWSEKDIREVEAGVRGAAAAIIEGKRATYYGIGMAVARLVDAIIHDRRAIFTVSNVGVFDDEVCISTPCVIGSKGIHATIIPTLSLEEEDDLKRSSEILLSVQRSVLKGGKLLI